MRRWSWNVDMGKWRTFIIISTSILLLFLFIFSYIPLNKYILKKDVRKHLIAQGYSISEIESIDVFFGKAPLFSARVIFSDEKNVVYYYMKDHKKVRQFGTPTGSDGNEIFESDSLLHVEKRD